MLLTSSGSKKKEPRYLCLSAAKASHSQRMWAEISSVTPQFLHSGLSSSPSEISYSVVNSAWSCVLSCYSVFRTGLCSTDWLLQFVSRNISFTFILYWFDTDCRLFSCHGFGRKLKCFIKIGMMAQVTQHIVQESASVSIDTEMGNFNIVLCTSATCYSLPRWVASQVGNVDTCNYKQNRRKGDFSLCAVR